MTIIVPIVGLISGMIVWLRYDMSKMETRLINAMNQNDKKLRDDMSEMDKRLVGELKRVDERQSKAIESVKEELKGDNMRLEEKMDAGFLAMEGRLRGVETEQARVAGLLEGLALTSRLPLTTSEPQ